MVSAAQVTALLKILSSFNAKGALAAWEGQDTQAKVINGLVAEDNVLKIVGVFFPPVAIVANDEEVILEAAQILIPLMKALNQRFPYKQPPGTMEAWGSLSPTRGCSMSLFNINIASWFHTTEQKVLAIVTDIKTDVEVAVSDIEKGLGWVASNAPNIAAGIQQVEALVTSIAAATPGLSTNANVTKAIAEANVAVTALNAFATASNTGKNDAQALVSGYVAYQTAQAAVSSAKAAVVAAPTP